MSKHKRIRLRPLYWSRMLSSSPGFVNNLSETGQDLIRRLASGQRNQDIAAELGKTVINVGTHKSELWHQYERYLRNTPLANDGKRPFHTRTSPYPSPTSFEVRLFTTREYEVYLPRCRGMSIKEISAQENLKPGTVATVICLAHQKIQCWRIARLMMIDAKKANQVQKVSDQMQKEEE